MNFIVMSAPGGPQVLALAKGPEPVAGPSQVVVEVAAAGVNFMDTGVRRGLFWTEMRDPKVLGVEGAAPSAGSAPCSAPRTAWTS